MSSDDLWTERSQKVRNPLKEAVVNLKAWVAQPIEDRPDRVLVSKSTSPFASSIEFADICVTRRDKTPKISGGIMKDFETQVFSAQNGVDIFYGGIGGLGIAAPAVPGVALAPAITMEKWASAMEAYIPYGVAAYNSESGDPTQEYVGMPYIAVHSFGVVTIVNTSDKDWKPGDRIIARFCWSDDDVNAIKRRKPESDKEAPDRVPFVVERYDSKEHGWRFVGAKFSQAAPLLTALAGVGGLTPAAAGVERLRVLKDFLGTHLFNIWKILRRLMGHVPGAAQAEVTELGGLLTGEVPATAPFTEMMTSLKWFGAPFDLIWRDWTLGTCNGYIPAGDNGEITLGIGKY